jgi:tetratricopeptide (TPR) repeat protein
MVVGRVRLDSWKSIAEHLKRSPRTVQRWHADYGLPVHHFGGSKGPVFALSDELDGWLSGFVETPEESGVTGDLTPDGRKNQPRALVAEAGELWELRSETNLPRIAAIYRQAVDMDPAHAPAFVGLANAIVLAALVGAMRSSAAYPRAMEALKRAMRLDFEPLETRCTAAWLQMVHERVWRPAQEGFDEVLNRQPQKSFALSGRALLYVVEAKLPLASRYLRDAWRQNTFASVENSLRCWVEYLSGEYEQVLELVAHARSSGDNASFNAAIEALALIQVGPVSQGLKQIEACVRTYPDCLVLTGALGYAYAVSGQTGRAGDTIHRLKRMRGDSAYPIALAMMGLDERQQALSCLETSWAEGSLWSLGFRSDPILRPLSNNPRFESMLRKIGTPVPLSA